MGWGFIPWYTLTDDFDKDFGVDEWHGTNAFIRDGDDVFRTYFINKRGDEQMGGTWNYLDITALGRQEEWEDSPKLPTDPAIRVVDLARRVQRRATISGVERRYRPRNSGWARTATAPLVIARRCSPALKDAPSRFGARTHIRTVYEPA